MNRTLLAAGLSLTAAAQLPASAAPTSDRAQPASIHSKENRLMPTKPQSSRPAPPAVTPVEYHGIRYEQDMESYAHGGDQPGGYLAAIDAKTGEPLWILKVYELQNHSAVGVDNIGVYFTRMSLVPGRDELEIENETGARFVVDLARRTSTPVRQPKPASLPPIKIPE
ncbi:MAG: hypothetical protein FIA97_12850 [Methylococcaceae bacterium]|nr:hypothetical protein [Methylococcaceae bacterium]